MAPKDEPELYLAASAMAAVVNFPLWKASAIAQAGFKMKSGGSALRVYWMAMQPPYKGVFAVMAGMTWARGAIFWGSDCGKDLLCNLGFGPVISTVAPPLVISTLVQIVNMPIVRSSMTVQDPSSPHQSVSEAIRYIKTTKGIQGLWHGTSAGIMKTVPKYCTAIACKDFVESYLPRSETPTYNEDLLRSATKSICAGVTGAALTNPLDVLRNEMFKTDLSVGKTFQKLMREDGAAFMLRGIGKNLIAVAIPIAVTIFSTDCLVKLKYGRFA
jgi:hypothetical protein